MNDSQATFFGHPRGLATLFFTEMFERFTYYGMRALLTLFLSAAVASGGFGMTQQEAGAIYGIYTGAVYLFCVPGGWIADRILGQRHAVWYGGILIAVGNCILAIPGESQYLLSRAHGHRARRRPPETQRQRGRRRALQGSARLSA